MSAARALTLVESIVAVALVGGLMVAAINTAGNLLATRQRSADQTRGAMLAQRLMAEILRKPCDNPTGAEPGLGPSAAELAAGNRSLFSDVDDFTGYADSPPQDADGTPVPGFAGWKRAVAVEYVAPSDLRTVAGTDQGLKRVTVRVYRSGVLMATLTALRARAWDAAWNTPPGVPASAIGSVTAASLKGGP